MATATEVRRLAETYRASQTRRSALTAAYVAEFYRKKVRFDDPTSVDRWIDTVLPRILSAHDYSAELAQKYAKAARRLELGLSLAGGTYEPIRSINREQVATSLLVVGPRAMQKKMTDIRRLDAEPVQAKALEQEALKVTTEKVTGSVIRHVQNGGRRTLLEGQLNDRAALGYIRVTRARPCYFCAMLASRGPVFEKDSFESSDARFATRTDAREGEATAKVHDWCACSFKPVFRRDEPLMEDAEKFEDMWERWGAGGGGQEAIKRFRRGYDHWLKTGEFLEWDDVATITIPR